MLHRHTAKLQADTGGRRRQVDPEAWRLFHLMPVWAGLAPLTTSLPGAGRVGHVWPCGSHIHHSQAGHSPYWGSLGKAGWLNEAGGLRFLAGTLIPSTPGLLSSCPPPHPQSFLHHLQFCPRSWSRFGMVCRHIWKARWATRKRRLRQSSARSRRPV